MADFEVTQVIYDYQTLREMINDVSKDAVYQLGCNIDCSESFNDGGWKSFAFAGTLIGGGYAICNLLMNDAGFFTTLSGTLSGVGFVNCTVKNAVYAGVVAREIKSGTNLIERCYVENCLVEPTLDTGLGPHEIGGFAGYIRTGTIKECYVANTVIGQENSKLNQIDRNAGGFAGRIGDDMLAYSIDGTGGAGIFDCYTQNCTIYVEKNGGGFCGANNYEFYYDLTTTGIKRCYSSSRVILRDINSVKGGFVAVADEKAIHMQKGNFYNLDVFGINNGQGYGFAKITEQMKDIKTFEAQGFEFSIVNDDGTVIKKTWRIEDGITYPYLQFNKQYKDIIPQSFLKVRNTDNEDLYAPLVTYNDVNLKGIPHLFIRV